jgi:hypothetical protein
MLVIIVGGIPIAMPTVLSVTLALGAYKLAKDGAIVSRMSAVEELAGMNILCSGEPPRGCRHPWLHGSIAAIPPRGCRHPWLCCRHTSSGLSPPMALLPS